MGDEPGPTGDLPSATGADDAGTRDEPPVRPVIGIDAGFLHAETASTHWHVVGVLVLDDRGAPEPFGAEVMRRVLADRIDRAEVLSRRVVTPAARVGEAQWHHGPVDLDHHVRSVTIGPGAGREELAALVGEIAGRALDRDRPLWELTVVHGLADGRRAVIAKIHHALVDGVAAVGVLGAVLDPDPRTPPPRAGGAVGGATPGPMESMAATARGLVDHPAVVARALTRLVRVGVEAVRTVRPGGDGPTLPLTAPRTPLSRSITARRAAAFASVDLDAVRSIRTASGATFHDVAMACTAGAVRAWLGAIGDLPDRPLVAAVPTSVRRVEGAAGNEVSILFAPLPTHLDDPGDRLAFVRREMPKAKSFHARLGSTTLGSLALVTPWNLTGAVFRAYSDLGLADRLPPAVNLVCSSVPGPTRPLYCGGARVEECFPLGPIFDGAALNVTVMSYTDRVGFGFLTCPDVGPPADRLADAVAEAASELVTAARARALEPV